LKKVFVLGATGLIGSQVLHHLNLSGQVRPGTIRVVSSGSAFQRRLEMLLDDLAFEANDVLVNAIGVTKKKIDTSCGDKFAEAVWINSELPHRIASVASKRRLKVIHVTTDCVYSGLKGLYSESDIHDPNDFYGKTKSIGESNSPYVLNLRTSVIGPEKTHGSQFFDWLRLLPLNEEILGFENHTWSGVTSDVLGGAIASLAISGDFTNGTRHLIPTNSVTKKHLVELVLARLNREDVTVKSSNTQVPVDRSLATLYPDFSNLAFNHLGKNHSRRIEEMVEGMPIQFQPPGEDIDEYRV